MQTITNAAVSGKLSGILVDLGNIPVDRICPTPAPGAAMIDDLKRLVGTGGLYELVDGTLVEKAMGWRKALIAMALGSGLYRFVSNRNLGLVTGPDGFIRILTSSVRGPDVAFVSWDRLRDRKVPEDSVPDCVPDLAVEVMSVGNTEAEMSRKRHEYFQAGVRLVWMIDPRDRSVAVYTSITDYVVLDDTQKLTGGEVLPGFEIELAGLFAELDRSAPP